ncbi:MAG: hypothetical protein E6R03_07730 [Hyphomicrobiaceae bacterium]|nr:MAG: hypothetical protein E6R03_07730 [Hyphomicrobiaceae bacterium]
MRDPEYMLRDGIHIGAAHNLSHRIRNDAWSSLTCSVRGQASAALSLVIKIKPPQAYIASSGNGDVFISCVGLRKHAVYDPRNMRVTYHWMDQ